ncbi:RagB/SusD family nutrient uptake outer membrane protein [Pedobacter sp. ISL-68]|uniref:RagB/SusD family nutrient uptake outer membrane protein n=1 Tax=unclassified Pedobacter TaxID=2628915 RepID=UPI001BEA4E87|nr:MULTISPECIES: RagB/SusD family nutrient uptake outer membrane protein [unclassified Pedobacter]MBT2564102.1 RagB/SusD family nutrient uptake outer membrane protein [Pedobacter sp. ISL-64]MBT2589764.1 RagB/SusD family nutrient uptake outer membrane protein [Pedobacter sp. ISL-68]
MKTKIYHLMLVLLCTALLSCQKDYLDKSPLSGPSDESFFSNQDELILAVNGLYRYASYAPLDNMPLNLLTDNGTDIGWDRNNSALQSLGKGNQDSNNGFSLSVWTEGYKVIAKCNFILDNIDKVKDKATTAIYNRSKAEARFMRAYTYQYLIDYFGSVPLVTRVLTLEDSQLPKTPKAEVLSFVLRELTESAADLPVSYGAADVGRATRGTALAIKARAALNNERWADAAEAAKAVMDLKIYSLHNNFGTLFSYAGQNSPEIIWAFQYLKASKTKMHSTPNNLLSRNGLGFTNKVPSQSLVDAYPCTDGLNIDKSPLYDPTSPYKNRDPRLGFTIAVPGSIFYNYQFETHRDSVKCWNYNTTPATRVDNQDALNAFATFTGYCWKKYVDLEDKADRTNSELNVIQIRYAEILLIYAEAKNELGQLDQSVYDAINLVRTRPSVNMPAITTGKTMVEFRSLVRKERMYELAMEGFRISDLRRWKIADKAMTGNFYGRVQKGLLVSAPQIDVNGLADYSAVPNRAELRVIEVRVFDTGRDYLWPLPNIEIVTNPKLIQNPKY